MRTPSRCLLLLSVAACACRGGLRAPAHNADATAEAGTVDSGTGHETAPAGPEVANDGVSDRPAADRELPDSPPVSDSAPAGPEVANDGVADRPGADRELPDLQPAPDRPDVAPDHAVCYGSEKESCVTSTCVLPFCDYFPPTMPVYSAPGGPLLAQVRVTSGPCGAPPPCSSGCERVSVSPGTSLVPDGGATCDFVAIATDGRSEAFSVTIVQHEPSGSGMCCASSYGGGYWIEPSPYRQFDPREVVVHFDQDGGVPDGSDAGDSGTLDGGTRDTD